MQFGEDDSPVAFAPDHGIFSLHHIHHVYLAYCRRKMFATRFARYIAEGNRTRQVRDGRAGLLVSRPVFQYIIGHGHQRIFLAKGRTIFTNQGQPIHIGVHHDAEVDIVFFGNVNNIS